MGSIEVQREITAVDAAVNGAWVVTEVRRRRNSIVEREQVPERSRRARPARGRGPGRACGAPRSRSAPSFIFDVDRARETGAIDAEQVGENVPRAAEPRVSGRAVRRLMRPYADTIPVAVGVVAAVEPPRTTRLACSSPAAHHSHAFPTASSSMPAIAAFTRAPPQERRARTRIPPGDVQIQLDACSRPVRQDDATHSRSAACRASRSSSKKGTLAACSPRRGSSESRRTRAPRPSSQSDRRCCGAQADANGRRRRLRCAGPPRAHRPSGCPARGCRRRRTRRGSRNYPACRYSCRSRSEWSSEPKCRRPEPDPPAASDPEPQQR